MTEKMILTVVSGVLLVFLGMQLLLFGLPFFRRIEFDAICHKYAMLMDQSGGLTEMAAAQMAQELGNSGFTVTQITGTGQAAYGEELSLFIQVACDVYVITGDLFLEEVERCFEFQSSLYCRKIRNYAADP